VISQAIPEDTTKAKLEIILSQLNQLIHNLPLPFWLNGYPCLSKILQLG
jgi:hypothetical protein